jgi:hypothetical protein
MKGRSYGGVGETVIESRFRNFTGTPSIVAGWCTIATG